MAKTKTDKTRNKKAQNFKEQSKKSAAQAATPRTHLLPQTEWQSTTNLDLRGDLAEAFEVHMVQAFEALQKAGSVFQQMMALNIEAGKVKINYIWNNGEIPTDEEVEQYKQAMAYMQQQREQLAQTIKNGGVEQGPITQLETVGGQPLTAENLDQEKGGLIVLP